MIHQCSLLNSVIRLAKFSHDSPPSMVDKQDEVKHMLQFTQLALSLSPLVLLVTRNGATRPMNSLNFFQVSLVS
jgi:hypothetical protein